MNKPSGKKMTKLWAALAMGAALLTGCSQTEIVETEPGIQYAVEFQAYKSLHTPQVKASVSHISNATDLQELGIGVFAYYTDNKKYQTLQAKPNFMYNQKVSGSNWSYDPVKYWPNEWNTPGTDLGSGATSTGGQDCVSFFAYAPYTTGSSVEGLELLTTANTTDDPRLRYTLPGEGKKAIDLMWAVGTDGKPHIDETKKTVGEKVGLRFRHALTSIKPTVQAVVDAITPDQTKALSDKTKITIDKITIKALNHPTTGILNLNNTTANQPRWETTSGTATTTYEISTTKQNLNTSLRDTDTDKKAAAISVEGVTTTQKPLLVDENNNQDIFTFIPYSTAGTQQLNVTADYWVTTDDDDLVLTNGHWRVKNHVEQTVDLTNFTAGKQFTLNMLLGMTTMKFDVNVQEWGAEENFNNGGKTHEWEVPGKTGSDGRMIWDTAVPEKIKDNGQNIDLLENIAVALETYDQLQNPNAHQQFIIEYEISDLTNYRIGIHKGENAGEIVEFTNTRNTSYVDGTTGTITYELTAADKENLRQFMSWKFNVNNTYIELHPDEVRSMFTLYLVNVRVKKITFIPK